jgi:Zn-dependent protease
VFFLEPDQTPYDLRWRMFGIPVRVHPLFWLVAVLLGWDFLNAGLLYLGLWVLCVFVSILLHEMGHVLMGRLFGARGHIVLYSFGGLAIGSNDLRSRWQRIAVLAAGPGIQLLLWGALVVLAPSLLVGVPEQWRLPVTATVLMLWQINLFWPILNLLPIWPLDGGQISREALEGLFRDRGTTLALGISACVSGLLAVHALLATLSHGKTILLPYVPAFGMFTALFFAYFCINSFQALQAENARRRPWDDRMPWER